MGHGQKFRERPRPRASGHLTFSRTRGFQAKTLSLLSPPARELQGVFGWAEVRWQTQRGLQWSWSHVKCAQIPDTQNSLGQGIQCQEALVQHLGSWWLQAGNKEPLLAASMALEGKSRHSGWVQRSHLIIAGSVNLRMLVPSSQPQFPLQ